MIDDDNNINNNITITVAATTTSIMMMTKMTTMTMKEEEEERSGGCQAAIAAPITPAATAPRAIDQAQAEQPTPPKVDAPKVELGVDLLGLDFDPKMQISAPADTVNAVDQLDLL